MKRFVRNSMAALLAASVIAGSFPAFALADEAEAEVNSDAESIEVIEDGSEETTDNEASLEDEAETEDISAGNENTEEAEEETEAEAQQGVVYTAYSWDSSNNTLVETVKTATDYTVVTPDLIRNSEDGKGLRSGTFVVEQDTTINDYVYIRKGCTVNLIVLDGVTLTCTKGIGCGYSKNNEYATLNIYGTGKIVTTGEKWAAGIGGRDNEASGNISIHGTTIQATGGEGGAGIGGGDGGKDPDGRTKIVIYAGNITAVGGKYGSGIGGGDEQPGAHTYIYGGTISANGGNCGAGLGGGDEEGTLGIWIYDGTITTTGGNHGAGIGAGEEGGSMRKAQDGGGVNILGGIVTANGGSSAAGIGGGYAEDMSGTIYIGGDNTHVTALGGYGSAGIGAGDGTGDSLCSTNGDMTGTFTIACEGNSTVLVRGGERGAGIGAGYGGNMEGKFVMTGGDVKVYGGTCAAGIGGGQEDGWLGGEGGTAYIGGGHLYIVPGDDGVSFENDSSTAEAIGKGSDDMCSGTVYIHANNNGTGKYMQVSYCSLGKTDLKTVNESDRSSMCHSHNIIDIRECSYPEAELHTDGTCVSGHQSDEHSENRVMSYLGMPMVIFDRINSVGKLF